MKHLINSLFILSILSLPLAAQVRQDKINQAAKMERTLDNLCGDTWCEGTSTLKSIQVRVNGDQYDINMVHKHETGAIIQTFCSIDSEKIDDVNRPHRFEDFFDACLTNGLDIQTKGL